MTDTTVQPNTQTSVDVMARTLYGEARGCGADGMKHVAMVILNRVHHPRWWGTGVIGVCQAPYQFSCWNKNDPNRAKIEAVTDTDPIFVQAIAIATQAIAGNLPDVTSGADSYFALSMAQPPTWIERATKTYQDAWHAFYRVELPMPGTATPAVPDGDPRAAPVALHSIVVPPAAQAADDSADALDAKFNPTLDLGD